MPYFCKKPVVIEAIQLTGDNADVIVTWARDTGVSIVHHVDGTLTIPTLEGEHLASLGDWIIKGVKSEFYPCKPDIFEITYAALSDIE